MSLRYAVVCTDNNPDKGITEKCIARIENAKGLDGVVVIRQHRSQQRSGLSYFVNLICGIQQLPADSLVFVCEHDVLYPDDYFFRPSCGLPSYGLGGYFLTDQGFCPRDRAPLSSYMGTAHELRHNLLGKLHEDINGTLKSSEPFYEKTAKWNCPTPFIDIRHGKNLTSGQDFRNTLPPWEVLEGWTMKAYEMWQWLK